MSSWLVLLLPVSPSRLRSSGEGDDDDDHDDQDDQDNDGDRDDKDDDDNDDDVDEEVNDDHDDDDDKKQHLHPSLSYSLQSLRLVCGHHQLPHVALGSLKDQHV